MKQRSTWTELYTTWQFQLLSADWNNNELFTPIKVSSPSNGLRIGNDICDWWPREEINARCNALTHNGIMGVYWQTNKGTSHTAELLYECRNNLEAQVAVFIAASLWDKLNPLPIDWRGELYRKAHDLLLYITTDPESPFERLGLQRWHHAMRSALPMKIIDQNSASFVQPQSYDDFLQIAAIETVLSTSLWTPVLVSHVDVSESLH